MKHDTDYSILRLKELFLKVQRIIGEKFRINYLERDPETSSNMGISNEPKRSN